MHAPRLRVRTAVGALALGAAMVPFVGAGAAYAAPTDTPTAGDVRATAYPGNIHDGKAGSACSQLGFGNDVEIAVDGSSGYDSGGYTITSDDSLLKVEALPSGKTVDALIVKGGPAYNVYPHAAFTSLPVSGLHAPMVGKAQDNIPTISHWFLCAGAADSEVPPPNVPATATVTGNCDTATVTMDAGTDAGSFSVDPAGTSAADAVAVPAKTEVVNEYPVDAAHPTVTVSDESTDTATELDSYTRPAACDDQGGETAVDPKVAFSNSCAQGITVVFSNMKLDDTTTLPVMFTVVTPSGATEHVVVKADHIIKKSYAVTEGTTGAVTVSAPGMATTSKSYAKKCTKVLGEKVTKTPDPKTKVLGDKVSRLPMTGISPLAQLALAAGMLLLGLALNRAGARRAVVDAVGRHRL